MPTRGRQRWALQALDCFRSQAYPNKELIIVDDMQDRSFPDGIALENVRYHLMETTLNIPQKRNKACEYSKGDMIMHFDSDDWSDPRRMGQQVGYLMESGKAVTGYHSILFFQEPDRVAKYTGRSTYACGTSLCYRRSFWETHNWKEDKILASDNLFVMWASTQKALHTMDGGQMIVARVHGGNTCSKSMSSFKAMTLADLPEGFPK